MTAISSWMSLVVVQCNSDFFLRSVFKPSTMAFYSASLYANGFIAIVNFSSNSAFYFYAPLNSNFVCSSSNFVASCVSFSLSSDYFNSSFSSLNCFVISSFYSTVRKRRSEIEFCNPSILPLESFVLLAQL